jgi:CubicO group peptidase (beta-lactamase class C family)
MVNSYLCTINYHIMVCIKSYSIKVILAGIALFLFIQTGFCQSAFPKLDTWLEKNTKNLGGRAVLLIYKDGKLLYDRAKNEMSRKQKLISKLIARKKGMDADELMQDFDTNTRQRIASCSKWLSAALVMSFVDEGKLGINDTVGKFLPVLSRNGKGNITIWQCLSHLTAIKPGSLKESIGEITKVPDMDSAISIIAALPMEGEPGKVFNYSNTGLQIAAAVIEKISGKEFETLFAERIARPCGMVNTDFGKVKVPLAAGGAWSTPNDYMQFLVMLLNNGSNNGKQVLSKKSVEAMQQNYTKDAKVVHSPAEAGNWGYGFGEWVMEDAAVRSDAVTSPGLFGSFPWVDNRRGYAGFLFVFNIKSKGRNELYRGLKKTVDESFDKQQ